MDEYLQALLLFFGTFGILGFAFYYLWEVQKIRKLQTILNRPFPQNYQDFLDKTPHYKALSSEQKQWIHVSILRFVNTKAFLGVEITVTDEIKVIVAFYACLLMLGVRSKNCYDELQTIIVYPHAVLIKQVQSYGGIYTKEQFVLQGQSANGTVVISWHDAKKEAYHLRHNNVIVHEFAHEIDFMDGEIDGVPPIERSKYNGWIAAFSKEYKALSAIVLKNRDWGKYKLIGEYASTNEAEFFAVVTERFFESPSALKRDFPALYNELRDFYKLDTATLFT